MGGWWSIEEISLLSLSISTGISRYSDIINIICLHSIDTVHGFHLQNICYSCKCRKFVPSISGGQITHILSLNNSSSYVLYLWFLLAYQHFSPDISQAKLETPFHLWMPQMMGISRYPEWWPDHNKYWMDASWKHQWMDLWFSILSVLYVVD